VLSGGNFHAEPVAFAADTLALALAEMGSLSERQGGGVGGPQDERPARHSLVDNSGVNSGFMIAQVTAAALVSENKAHRCHPAASTRFRPPPIKRTTSAWRPMRARRLRLRMVDNAAAVVGIELLAAAQGIDFHRPCRSSSRLEQVHAQIRGGVAFYDSDRYFAPDIAFAKQWVRSGRLTATVARLLPSTRPV
jgi:histidine ammonia-lyase